MIRIKSQVIDNIISNAIKYSPDGGNIRFGFTGQEDMLKVMISDDGMGIPKENVGRILIASIVWTVHALALWEEQAWD